MSSLTPTYIPSPNWDIPADSDIVVLGRLIKDPKNPESQVPKTSADPIPPPKVYEGEKTDWQTTLERARSGTIGIWAKCLQFLGGQLSFSQLKSAMEDHKFANLETKYFVPNDEYLELALQDAGVQAYFQVHNSRKPVYLITGIKTAKGASISTETSTERSVEAQLKVDGSALGAPVEAGPEASWSSKDRRGISYAGSTDYIFAYQLMRLKPKGKGQGSLNERYVQGAVFGRGEEDDAGQPVLRDLYSIEEEVSLGFPDSWEQVDTKDEA
ncbi:hypothetical protein ACJ41O_010458 [Fusarium nematophilum]